MFNSHHLFKPGEYSRKSYTRGGGGQLAPRFDPLLFYIPFLIEKVPLSYTFKKESWASALIDKLYP